MQALVSGNHLELVMATMALPSKILCRKQHTIVAKEANLGLCAIL